MGVSWNSSEAGLKACCHKEGRDALDRSNTLSDRLSSKTFVLHLVRKVAEKLCEGIKKAA